MNKEFKPSLELRQRILSSLKISQLNDFPSNVLPIIAELTLCDNDKDLLDEIVDWTKNSQELNCYKVDIGKYFGLFPYEIKTEYDYQYFNVEVLFSVDFIDENYSSWKDWFIVDSKDL